MRHFATRKTFFALDIGTEHDDLAGRYNSVKQTLDSLPDEIKNAAEKSIFYSAGIWPSVEEIANRENAVKTLRAQIEEFNKAHPKKLVAVGECGIDHHWNPAGVDKRDENDFSEKIAAGEKELFESQLSLSKELNIPAIIHSRDGFDSTLDSLKNIGFHKGIIHCFSYGKTEAKQFLDLGWHIALGGAVTYTKKSKLEEMTALLRYIPEDRILLETDAPYLAPVPFRGKTNSPILIEETYAFIAEKRQTTPERLSETVDKNIAELFSL